MKSFYKLYATISIAFISGFILLIAIYPTEFLNFCQQVYDHINSGGKVTTIYSLPLPTIETIFSYLGSLYVVNIIANIVIWLLAYISENKFYNRLIMYTLIINLVYLFIIIYTVKLLLESGYRLVQKVITRK